MIQHQFELKKVNLTFNPGENLPWVEGRANQLRQVFTNIILNALQASEEGDQLIVGSSSCGPPINIEETTKLFAPRRTSDQIDANFSLQRSILQAAADSAAGDKWVQIRFADAGTGMQPDIIKHIFDPFFTTKEPGKGTGLGLSTSYAIVQRHKGLIEVESEPGRGTTFRVILPGMDEPPESVPEADA